ncbi:MAG: T9SS type A sorting domain-containing protein [Bacteroidia bacterium]
MYKICITILLFLSFTATTAEGQIILNKQKTIGGSLADLASGMVKTTDGGWVIAGTSTSGISGDKTEACRGSSDYWVIRTDSSGNILWDKTFGGNDEEICKSILSLQDGSFVIAGYSSSGISGDKTEQGYGFSDYWIVRIDSAGNKIWDKTLGSSFLDYLTCAMISYDGKIVIGGYSNSPNNLIKNENTKGGFDFWILKLDTAGNIIWQNTIGGSNADKPSTLLELPDNSILITGSSASPVSSDKTSAGYGQNDFWIVRISSTGTLLGQFCYGGSLNDEAKSAVFMPDGSFLFTGESNSPVSGVKTINSFGDIDIWALRVNTSGVVLWQSLWGTNLPDQNARTFEHLGKIYITGISSANGSGVNVSPSKGMKDTWLICADYLLQEIYQSSLGGSENDILTSAFADSSGMHFLMSSDSPNSADKNEGCKGDMDFWLASGYLQENFSRVEGSLWYDLDSNMIWDSNEVPVKYHRVTINNGNGFAFSNYYGRYLYNVIDTGTFIIEPNFLTYFDCQPSSDTVQIVQPNSTISNISFGYVPNDTISDLSLELIPIGPFRAGQDAKFLIQYTNQGFIPAIPVIHFIDDPNLLNPVASITPSAISGDTITWSPATILPFQSQSILLTFTVDTSTPVGEHLHNFAYVETLSSYDINPFNNSATWEIHTTGSNDPNDITPSLDSIPDSLITQPPALTYLIRFQNTGNDTAFYVNIKNTLPFTLIDTSLEILSSSHPMEIHYDPSTRLVEFTFDEIELPDSNHNEPESHGYVLYRIQPVSTLSLSDTIKNTAGIYFDYNPVVLTNTATTVFYHPVSGVGLGEQNLYPAILYPNPAKDQVHIRFDPRNPEAKRCSITDLSGRMIKQTKVQDKTEFSISISELSDGIYFMQTTYDGGFQSSLLFTVDRD